MTDDFLYLGSEELFSKWGFGDGDVPDAFLDYCDHYHLPYPEPEEWHQLLVGLVETRLLPMLPVRVETCALGTIHNPIRAERVDGTEVVWIDGSAASARCPNVALHIPFRAVADHLAGIRATGSA